MAGGAGKKLVAAGPLLLVLAMFVGCGSSSPPPGGEGIGTTAPSTEFMRMDGNNRPATFGEVASEREREAASQILEASMKSRAAGDWEMQCATLSAFQIDKLQSDAPNFGGGHGCVTTLREEAEPLSSTEKARANTMIEPIAVLRVKGKVGYALYHGAGHRDYAMLMEKEGGEWKVGHLATSSVP